MTPKNISVLVMPVNKCPELQHFRKKEMIKSTAILGPHVSILGVFEPDSITPSIINQISEITGRIKPIKCLFSQFGVFPDVPALYMSVYPATPFESLREALLPVFPWYTPEFPGHVFHLSLAYGFKLSDLQEVTTLAHEQLDSCMPLETTLSELHLTDRIDGAWKTRKTFILKG